MSSAGPFATLLIEEDRVVLLGRRVHVVATDDEDVEGTGTIHVADRGVVEHIPAPCREDRVRPLAPLKLLTLPSALSGAYRSSADPLDEPLYSPAVIRTSPPATTAVCLARSLPIWPPLEDHPAAVRSPVRTSISA